MPIDLAERIDTLHVLRMLELLGGEIRLDADVSSIVVARFTGHAPQSLIAAVCRAR